MPKTIRHWAFYGGAHAGLAIEFDGQHKLFQEYAKGRFCFKVKYEEVRPKCSLSDFDNREYDALVVLLRKWAAVKSKAWEPEDEWRLIMPLVGCRRVVDGERVRYLMRLWDPKTPSLEKTQIIRRVIIGCRASEELKASVRAALARPHLQHVQAILAREDDSKFRFNLGN